jgi:hypothetical protein
MKSAVAIIIGVLWLWWATPTYASIGHPLHVIVELVALAIGLALVGGGLFSLARRPAP